MRSIPGLKAGQRSVLGYVKMAEFVFVVRKSAVRPHGLVTLRFHDYDFASPHFEILNNLELFQ